MDADRGPSLAGLPPDAFGIVIGHGLVLHPNPGVRIRRLGRAGGGPVFAAPAGGGDPDPFHVPGAGAGGAYPQRQSAGLAHSGAGHSAGNDQRIRYAGPAVAHHPDDLQRGSAERNLAEFGDLQRRPRGGSGRRGQDSPWAHLVEGLMYVHAHRPVRTLLGMMAATTIAGMPALVLMPFFADAIFHRGSRGMGILMGAMGAGAVAGTLVLAWRARVSTLPKVIFRSALLLGASFCFFACSNVFYFSLAVMPLIGYSVMRQMASANTLIQTLIPDEFRGRIMAFYTMTVVGMGPFGSLAAGALAHAYGPRLTVAAGGALAMAAAGVFRIKCNVFREVR